MKSIILITLVSLSFSSLADRPVLDMNQDSKIESVSTLLSTVVTGLDQEIAEIENEAANLQAQGDSNTKYLAHSKNLIASYLEAAKEIRRSMIEGFETDVHVLQVEVDKMTKAIDSARRLLEEELSL